MDFITLSNGTLILHNFIFSFDYIIENDVIESYNEATKTYGIFIKDNFSQNTA